LVYRLGLDYESAGAREKAAQADAYVAKTHPDFKDVSARLASALARRIGRYEIVRELGRGGMGVVFLARDSKLGRQVAVKTLPVGSGAEPAAAREARARFLREAESAGALDHPGILKVFDAGETEEGCFIAMEYLDGEDLAAFATKGKLLPPRAVLECVAQAAEALHYAHTRGIVHLDVKPANIVRLKDGSVRVADFGIARALGSPKAGGPAMGTLAYMSPERIEGRAVDARADVFSLGAVLYELLCGQRPFTGSGDAAELLARILRSPEPELKTLRPDVPPCAAEIAHKALRKAPGERFQTAEQMAAALRTCLGEPVRRAAPTPEEIASALVLPGAPAQAAPTVELESDALLEATLEEAASELGGPDAPETTVKTGKGAG
ncbi:MAG TPA: serine/threonine-protein kinase, partial [Elusimicrobiota bacterium]|nr:serine/threonine-protein kinase [Elusimicrobiota bacterium]